MNNETEESGSVATDVNEQATGQTDAGNEGTGQPNEANPKASQNKTTEAVKTDEQVFPKKYLNADGKPDYDKLAKAYVSLEKKLGSKPNVPAASADEYEWDFGDMQPPEENVAAFKQEALSKGLTKEQYQWMMKTHSDVIKSMVWDADRTEAELKTAWGKDFQAQANSARAAFDEFAPSDADPNDPVWNHPAVMKMLARMGGELGEDSLARKSPASSSGMQPAEVIALMKSKEYQSGSRELHQKVQSWFQAGGQL
jgi:hypothetical protein